MAEPQAVLTPSPRRRSSYADGRRCAPRTRSATCSRTLAGYRRSVGFRTPEAGLTCVVGVGAGLGTACSAAAPGRPAPVPRSRGRPHTAPATPGDLFFHIRAHRLDLCFELAQRSPTGCRFARRGRRGPRLPLVRRARPARVRRRHREPGGRGRRAAVLIGDEDPEFAGGSYVVVQKYLHDLDAWNALPVEEQERAIGRTKLNDVEFPDEAKPANSHVALNTIIDDDGEEHQIVRFNMPFGRVGAA